MPGCFRQVPGGVVSFEAYYPQTMPKTCLEDTVLWDRRWCYQRRSPDTFPQWDQTFISTGCWWPMLKSGAFSDPTTPSFFSEDTNGFMCGAFAAWEYGLGGSKSSKYIMGQCKQVSGDPYGGATVYGYRASDGLIIGNVSADDKGYYELMCPNTPTDAHFLVARGASNTYIGSTVPTLIPTWRDGSV